MPSVENKIVEAILSALVSSNDEYVDCKSANVVDGLFAIANSLREVASAMHKLGTNGANTSMGAIEMLAFEVKDGFEKLSNQQE